MTSPPRRNHVTHQNLFILLVLAAFPLPQCAPTHPEWMEVSSPKIYFYDHLIHFGSVWDIHLSPRLPSAIMNKIDFQMSSCASWLLIAFVLCGKLKGTKTNSEKHVFTTGLVSTTDSHTLRLNATAHCHSAGAPASLLKCAHREHGANCPDLCGIVFLHECRVKRVLVRRSVLKSGHLKAQLFHINQDWCCFSVCCNLNSGTRKLWATTEFQPKAACSL